MITVPQSINLLINRLGKRQDRNERQCRELGAAFADLHFVLDRAGQHDHVSAQLLLSGFEIIDLDSRNHKLAIIIEELREIVAVERRTKVRAGHVMALWAEVAQLFTEQALIGGWDLQQERKWQRYAVTWAGGLKSIFLWVANSGRRRMQADSVSGGMIKDADAHADEAHLQKGPAPEQEPAL